MLHNKWSHFLMQLFLWLKRESDFSIKLELSSFTMHMLPLLPSASTGISCFHDLLVRQTLESEFRTRFVSQRWWGRFLTVSMRRSGLTVCSCAVWKCTEFWWNLSLLSKARIWCCNLDPCFTDKECSVINATYDCYISESKFKVQTIAAKPSINYSLN